MTLLGSKKSFEDGSNRREWRGERRELLGARDAMALVPS